uniref:Beta-sarcoglycan n=1 Tax=Clastoptera arizonana TaxID=38151 RepID=A0A1B6CMK0_9HEMI
MASSRDSQVTPESGMATMSFRDKTLLKRNINRHHNNNMSAGYVPVHEESLHKTGLRGRKTYAFWTLVGLLSLMAIANMVLTCIIFKVLRIWPRMESFEILPEQSIIKFHGKTDLDQILKQDGKIEGFKGEPIKITGQSGPVNIDLLDANGNLQRKLKMQDNETHFQGIDSFEVHDPVSGKVIFSTASPNFRLPKGVHNINVVTAKTNRITSPFNKTLTLKSDSFTRLKGNEGTKVEGKEILWSADQFIFLRSVNGSIIFNSTKGVYIDVKNIPSVTHSSDKQLVGQFKICVCMPEGKLFKVPVSPDQDSHLACNINITYPHVDPCK